jgi:hypothetical protein
MTTVSWVWRARGPANIDADGAPVPGLIDGISHRVNVLALPFSRRRGPSSGTARGGDPPEIAHVLGWRIEYMLLAAAICL